MPTTTSLADTIYNVVSAIFFAFCAYAQSNDPDPQLWMFGYLWGGVMLNFVGSICVSSTTVHTFLIRPTLIINGGFLFYWIVDLLPRLDYSQNSLFHWCWSILEYEEGREIGGLLVLCWHVYQLDARHRITKKQSKQSNHYTTILGLLLLGGCAYLWKHYQPLMNAKHNTEHCNGAFANTLFGGGSKEL